MSAEPPTPRATGTDPLVPISALFHDDAGPHLVQRGHGASADRAAPSGTDLNALLGAGIAGLSEMAPEHHATEEELVPVESLLYRGRAALDRAIAIADQVAARDTLPDRDRFGELRDLLHLATSE
jgi:hypothetical protein